MAINDTVVLTPTGNINSFWHHLFLMLNGPIQHIFGVYIRGFIALYGVTSNVLNLAVFRRQGITADSCTVSLAALALSDLCCCIFNTWGFACLFMKMNRMPIYRDPKILFNDLEVYFGRYPVDMFVQLSCAITCYMAMERCCGVVFPFKVQQIFTARRSLAVVIGLYLTTLALFFPIFTQELPAWDDAESFVARTFPMFNMNSSVFASIDFNDFFPRFAYIPNPLVPASVVAFIESMNTLVIRPLCIIVVFVCNLTIYWKVNLARKFKSTKSKTGREAVTTTQGSVDQQPAGASTSSNSARAVHREQKLLRMIYVLCTVFLLCNVPAPIFRLFSLTQYLRETPHKAMVETFYILQDTFECLNASININIYYTMSTRFRNELRRILHCRRK